MDFPTQYARTRRFTLGAPRNVSLSIDGNDAYFLRSKAGDDPVLCLWHIDLSIEPASAGDSPDGASLLIDPRALFDRSDRLDRLPEAERARRERARESAGGIVDYSMTPDGGVLAFALNGSLFCHHQGQSKLLSTAGGVFDPRIDPTGTAIAYVGDNALRLVERDRPGSDRLLAGEPDCAVSWGKAEFLAAEEMHRSRGYWWSPDGRNLLACRVDNSSVDTWWIADPANPQATPTPVRYPAAGTTNATVELWLTDLEAPILSIDWSDDGRFEYLADVIWTSGHPPLVVRQTRDQRTVSIGTVDLTDGIITEIRRIEDDLWVELVAGSPCWLGDDLLTIEDRCDADGDRRALCRNGRPTTAPGLNVRSIVGVDESSQPSRVFLSAWTDPTEVHLAVHSPEDGTLEWITTEPGVHTAISSGHVVAMTSLTPDRPGPDLRILGAGSADRHRSITSHVETPVISVRPRWCGEEEELRSVLFLPSGHDGIAPLPVLLDPYAGPHAQRVLKAHNSHLASQWFADQGFAVLVTDGRGTPGRGPRFERAVWGDLAQPVLDDQIEALDRVADRFGCLDRDRVAIRGWSFGGYLAALAVLRRPDRVHAAVAGAPVTTWRLYDTHYTERYLGHPEQFPQHYDSTDLILEAGRLERPLLLVHGLADDNVVAAHTLRLSSALLVNGRPHAVIPLSGVTHMTPQVATAENLLRLELDFLRTALETAS